MKFTDAGGSNEFISSRKCWALLLMGTWLISVSSAKGPLGITEDDYKRECRMTFDGQEYFFAKGYYYHGDNIRPCRPWIDFPFIRVNDILEKDLRNNYCRNPGNHTEPYCYGYLSDKKQSCNVPLCPQLEFSRTSQKGKEYYGNLNQSLPKNCSSLCEAHKGLGPACQENEETVWVPCDIPMQEIPVLNTTYRNVKTFIPLTTWYVLPSLERIGYLGPGEMLIRLPDTSGMENPPFTMKFRLRLADPNDADAFYFNMNLLPDDSFIDYYNLTFAKTEIEVQRFVYTNISIYNPQNDTKNATKKDDEEDEDEEVWTVNRTEIRVNIETSGKFTEVPWLKLRYEWVEFILEIHRPRIALYLASKATPLLELKIPFHQFGAADWQFKERNVISGYSPPKYVNFHSHNGTVMVVIDQVNGHFFECIQGKVKMAINSTMHPLPMGVMPIDYATRNSLPSNDMENQMRLRTISIELYNIPVVILFTSAPLYKGIKTSADDDIIGLFVNITTTSVTPSYCLKIKSISKSFNVQCDESQQGAHITSPIGKVPVGNAVIISILNSISLCRLQVRVSVNEVKEFELQNKHYFRYWMILKEEYQGKYPTYSDVAPLKFSILHTARCQKGPTNAWLSECLNNELSLDGKIKNAHYREEYLGQISWAKTGKSCLPWSIFDNWLLVLLFGDKVPKDNFCAYLPKDNYELYDEEKAKARKKMTKEQQEKEMEPSFWCFVTLSREREECVIPKCDEIYNEMQCGTTPEHKECDLIQIPPSECEARPLCDEIQDSIFILNLNAPINEVTGLKNQIFYAYEGFAFKVKSYSQQLTEPLCLHLYHKETYPVAIFKITNSTLSLGYLGMLSYELKASSQITFYYLNTWSYNNYIITQSDKGWHLFHGGNLHPAITFNTALALYFVRFSSCTDNIPTKTGQMVVLSMELLPRTKGIREVLIASANPMSGDRNLGGKAEVDRFYPIGSRYDNPAESTIHLSIIPRTSIFVLNINLYKHLPGPSVSHSAHVILTHSILESLSGPPISVPQLFKMEIYLKWFPIHTSVLINVTYKSGVEYLKEGKLPSTRLRYFGIEVEQGEVEFIMF